MPYRYATKGYEKDHMSRAVGLGLSISTKQSIEICNWIRGKPASKAKKMLQNVIDEKRAVPFTRFNKDMGHKPKIGPGRYPKNACKAILELLEGAEANAQFKGLNSSELVIYSIIVNKAHTPWHYGRQRRRKMKRSNIEIVLKEKAKEKKKKDTPKKTENVKEKQEKTKAEKQPKEQQPKQVKKQEAKKE